MLESGALLESVLDCSGTLNILYYGWKDKYKLVHSLEMEKIAILFFLGLFRAWVSAAHCKCPEDGHTLQYHAYVIAARAILKDAVLLASAN